MLETRLAGLLDWETSVRYSQARIDSIEATRREIGSKLADADQRLKYVERRIAEQEGQAAHLNKELQARESEERARQQSAALEQQAARQENCAAVNRGLESIATSSNSYLDVLRSQRDRATGFTRDMFDQMIRQAEENERQTQLLYQSAGLGTGVYSQY